MFLSHKKQKVRCFPVITAPFLYVFFIFIISYAESINLIIEVVF